MAHDRRPMSREEEDYYYHQRSHSQGGTNGYYDDTQGNPYAYYSQPQPSPDYGRNDPYRGQEVARDKYRGRYYSEDEDDVSGSNLLALHGSRCPHDSLRSLPIMIILNYVLVQYSDDSRHRRPSHSSRSRSKKRDKSRDDRDKDKEEPSRLDTVKKHFGASDQNYVASVLGMVAGGFLGGEAVKGNKAPLGVIGGALLGGLSANAMEKKREQIKEQKEEEESSRRRRKSDR